jgi:hypothetical protein
MKEIVVYELNSLYRKPMRVIGYEFGKGEKSVCVETRYNSCIHAAGLCRS